MTDDTVLIDNLPDVNDINVLLDAIEGIGAMVHRVDRHTVKINGKNIHDVSIEYDYIKKIRASYYLLERCLASIREQTLRFRADVISEAVRSISISKDFAQWARMWRSSMARS